MFLILSSKCEGFAQPDNWTPDLDKAYPFPTKIDALDYVREDIAKDQAAEIVPRFTGCRVVELRTAALARLRKIGFRAADQASKIVLEVGNVDLEQARRTWPRSMFGIPTTLVRKGQILPWGSPKPKDAPPDFLKKNR